MEFRKFLKKGKKAREKCALFALEVVQKCDTDRGIEAFKLFEGKLQKHLGIQYAESGEHEKAIKYHQEALAIAQERQNKEDEGKACRYLGQLYYQTGEYKLSIYYYGKYLRVAADSTAEAWANKFLGLSHQKIGQYKESIQYHSQCLEVFKNESNRREIAEANKNLGIAYRKLKEYDNATKKLGECLRISEKEKWKDLEQQMHQEIGYVHKAKDEHAKADVCFQRSLYLAEELKDTKKMAEAYGSLGELSLSQAQYPNAIRYFSQCLKEAHKAGDKVRTAFAHANMGFAHFQNKDPEKAIECYDKFSAFAKETIMNKSGEANVNISIGKSCAKFERYEKAIKFYQKGLVLLEDKEEEGKTHELLGDAYQNIHQYEDAKKHYEAARNVANDCEDNESKMRLDLKLGKVLCGENKNDDAIPYYYEALEIAKSLPDDKEHETDAYEELGNAFYSKSDYASSLYMYDNCLELAEQLSDSNETIKRRQRAHENLGKVYFALEKWSEAIKCFCSSCDVANDGEAIYRCERKMGNAYYEDGDYDNAIVYHRRCLEEAQRTDDKTGKAKSYMIMGRSYAKIDQPQNALEFYDKYLKTVDKRKNKSEVASVLLEAGKLRAGFRDYKKGIDSYCECLNLTNDVNIEQEVLEELGDACYSDSQYENALRYYQKRLDITVEPDSKTRRRIYFQLGKVAFSQKNISKAIECYLVALCPGNEEENNADIHEALGEAFMVNKNYDRAITHHKENLRLAKILLDEKRKQRAYESLGVVYSATKQWSLAIENYRHACDVAKTDDKAALGRCERAMGNAYYEVEKYDEAIELLEKGLKSNTAPSEIKESHRVIGHAYAKIGNYEKSEEFLTKYLTDLHDKGRQATAHGDIGRICVKTGRFQQAIECHLKALDIVDELGDETEEHCEVYCNLGCAYLVNGQHEKALKYQEKFLQLAEMNDKPKKARAYKKIGNIHTAAGDYEHAMDSYHACLEEVENTDKTTTVRVLGKLGCICSNKGWYEMAIDYHSRQANTAENLKDKARAFDSLGKVSFLNGDYSQALAYQEKYLDASKELHDIAQERLTYGNIASIHLVKGQYDEAISSSRKALQIEGNQVAKARAYGVTGCAYAGLGQYEKAKKCHRKELEIVEEDEIEDDKSGIARANGNMGAAHVGTGDYQRAIFCFRKEMKFAEEAGDKMELGRANENLGNYHAAIGECKKAIDHYGEFLQIAEDADDKAGIGRAKGGMGTIFTENGQYEPAIKCHEEELKIAKNLGNRVLEGQALGSLGNAYTGSCEYEKAIEFQQESLKIAEECGVAVDQRCANRNLGNTYMAKGQYQKALEYQKEALRISKELFHKAAEGRIHENMARAYCLSGQIEKAKEFSRKSLHIAQEIGDKAGEGRASGSMGNAYMESGQNMQAMGLYREYLRVSHELSNQADECDCHRNMAALFVEIGQHDKALECSKKSLEMAKNLKDRAREGLSYGIIGNVFMAISQYDKAIQNHSKHLKIAEDLGDRTEIGRANGNLAKAYSKTGQHQKAMKCHTEDKNIAEELSNRAQVGRAVGNMASTFAEIGHYEKAIDYHLNCLKIAEELNDKPSLAKARLGLGVSYKRTKQFQEAILHLHRLLQMSKDLDSQELTASAQELLGQCYQNDDVPKTCSFFAKSIINFQGIRDSVRDHDDFNISMSNRFAHVHRLLFESLLNLKQVKTALLVSDCGKSQALYDLTRKIVNCGERKRFSYVDPMEKIAQNPSTEIMLETSLGKVINSLQGDTVIFYAFGENDELHSWVISQEEVFHKSLKIDVPSMKIFLDKKIIRLKEAMNVGSKQEETPQKDVKASKLDTMACDNLLLKSDIESSQSKIEKLDDLHKSSSDDSLYNTTVGRPNPSANCNTHDLQLQDLYSTLIKPIEEHLSGSKLLIVAEGPLFTLPFAALLNPSEGNLCEKYSFQFIPSLHVLNACLSRPLANLGPALFVGNPKISKVYLYDQLLELRELPSAEKEVIKCSKNFNASPLLQQMATKETVLNRMKDASIIHIAAHGLLNRAEIILAPSTPPSPSPTTSLLSTTLRSPSSSPPPTKLAPASYLLSAEDVLKCTLKARLVVLSCCHSGRGEISSEGVVGIARSFLGSGARAVLVALWQIDDHATMKFMDQFYDELIHGSPVCAAVQQTMVALKNCHPAYPPKDWAAFQVLGEDIVLTEDEITEIRLASASS